MRTLLCEDRGLALLDMLVACALFAAIACATAMVYGLRPARTHATATALEAALSEARNLAAANAGSSEGAVPSGATIVIESDPLATAHSRISVFRSRPVKFDGMQPAPPAADAGFPPRSVPGTISFLGNALLIHEPFVIMLSGGGYASIEQLGGAYDAAQPVTYASDPGCPVAGAAILVAVGGATESHPFGCTGGAFVAN